MPFAEALHLLLCLPIKVHVDVHKRTVDGVVHSVHDVTVVGVQPQPCVGPVATWQQHLGLHTALPQCCKGGIGGGSPLANVLVMRLVHETDHNLAGGRGMGRLVRVSG